MMKQIAFCVLSIVALNTMDATSTDEAGLIEPGKHLGKIRVGMEHVEVLRILGAPHRQEDLEYDEGGRGTVKGVLREDWITPLALPENLEDTRPIFMSDFLSVYTRAGRVVQIEARSRHFKTVTGLSVESSAESFGRQYQLQASNRRVYLHSSAGGIPATKHFTIHEDAVEQGIGWRFGCFGNLAPDTDPADARDMEIVIVHAPGVPLLQDPDGGGRFIWKDTPGRRAGR